MDNKTNPSTAGFAAQALFTTYELVELIAPSIPTRDLILVAAVNQTCYSVITTSTTLTNKLRNAPHLHPPKGQNLNANKSYNNDQNVSFTLITMFGKILLRRIGDDEVIAWLPAPSNRAKPRPQVVGASSGRKVRFVPPFADSDDSVDSVDELKRWSVTVQDEGCEEEWCGRIFGLEVDERRYLEKNHTTRAGGMEDGA